ncbi:flagellar biosynthesis protein FlhB [Acidithiobacillus sp. IBUN Pt1247-S3]|uniref:flagellar biosynthesis protein FlhB n=1 Tax=Acidithiobacillus sp. IBUN Pt1247-S3 TaxID=3166642 RepID=UPI0034E3EC7D
MAEDSGQERNQQPTGKRIEEVRRKGQVPRSRELSTSAILLAAGGVFYLFGTRLDGGSQNFLYDGLHLSSAVMLHQQDMLQHLLRMTGYALEWLLPFLLILVLVVLFSGMALGGWNFSGKALVPDFSHLNPLTGLQRMVSRHALLELVKVMLKALVIGGIGTTLVYAQRRALLGLIDENPVTAIHHLFAMLGLLFLFMAGSTLLIVAFDVPFQLWSYNEKLKMTEQEVKDEMKEQEGNPEVKRIIRSLQREMARRRMMAAVPKASVVVTNPTHYAVALRYEEGKDVAPVLLAKGADMVAAKIRELAQEHGIPLVEAPPLARALYHHVELEQQIPAMLYRAVAELLAYLYQLRVARPGQMPVLPQEWSVPAELDQGGK